MDWSFCESLNCPFILFLSLNPLDLCFEIDGHSLIIRSYLVVASTYGRVARTELQHRSLPGARSPLLHCAGSDDLSSLNHLEALS